MSEKLNIEQLIRNGIDGAEISPSKESWKAIQRTLRWKQFLRFRPGQFNIYYAGALLLAGAALTWALAGRSDRIESTVPDEQAIPQIPAEQVTGQLHDESVNEASKLKAAGEDQIEKQDSNTTKESDPEAFAENQTGDTALAEEAIKSSMEDAFVDPVVLVQPEANLEEQLSVAYFTSSIQTGCAPLRVHFTDQSIHATAYHWDFGTGETSLEQNPIHTFSEAGRYMVTLTTENHGSQPTVSRMMIEVLEAPVADFQIEEGLEGIDNHVVLSLINYSTNANTFNWCLVNDASTECSQWSSNDYQPALELKSITPDSRSVRLEVIDENGCRDTAVHDLPLVVQSSETRIKFPTAFSPNPSGPGDGSFTPGSKRIDLFHPIYIEIPVEFRMRIYTRRGELVFETRDIYQGWDGYINQEAAASDVYVWMAEARWKDGKAYSSRGDVTLVHGQYW